MRYIDRYQLMNILSLTSSTTEESAKAFKKAAEIALEQPRVAYNDPSGTIHADFSNTTSQTIVALQCKSCGGVIDRDTMICRHCGMTYMLVNNEINPRHYYPDF